MTWRRTCGSTAGSSRASGRASGRRSTSTRILTRITLVGAVYLALIAILPEFLITGFKVAPIPFIGERLDAHPAAVRDRGLDVHVLLRRHVAADRRRRGDGHGAADRVAADHAALRRVHEEDADPGTPRVSMESGRCGRGRARAVIVCKSPAEIERMRAANELVADVLEAAGRDGAPGVTTADLDRDGRDGGAGGGAEPAFKGYRGFPADAVHVGEQRGGARHPVEEDGAPRRGHRLDRHRGEAGRVLRRLRGHVRGGAGGRRRAAR